MTKIINDLNTFLQSSFTLEKISYKSFLLKTEDNRSFILKLNHKNNQKVYRLLKNSGVRNVIYPLYTALIDNNLVELFPYYENNRYQNKQKLLNMQDALKNMHLKTQIKILVGKKQISYLEQIYKILDAKFLMLELLMQEVEFKEYKDDFDWLYLANYHHYLDIKKQMYHLNQKIKKFIEKTPSITYVLNHGQPSINHLVNMRLISFNNAKMAIPVSDIAKFYILNDHIKVDWFKVIDDWLNIYNEPFFKSYFKFLVYYIYLINIDFTSTELHLHMQSFSNITSKIKIFSTYFYTYQ